MEEGVETPEDGHLIPVIVLPRNGATYLVLRRMHLEQPELARVSQEALNQDIPVLRNVFKN